MKFTVATSGLKNLFFNIFQNALPRALSLKTGGQKIPLFKNISKVNVTPYDETAHFSSFFKTIKILKYPSTGNGRLSNSL